MTELTPFVVADHLHSPLAVAEYLAAALDDEHDLSAAEWRVFAAESVAALKRLQDERNEEDALRDKLADLLTATANALKGEPGPRMQHSWHDLAEWGQAARDVAMLYLASTGPGGTAAELKRFLAAADTWKRLFARDLAETAEAMSMLNRAASTS
jgi:DNA-binding phage protein